MDQGLLTKSQHCCLTNVDLSRLNSVTEEGETAAFAILSTPNRFGKPLCEKLAGPPNTHRRRTQPSDFTQRGVDT
jgi:hypothetical protein